MSASYSAATLAAVVSLVLALVGKVGLAQQTSPCLGLPTTLITSNGSFGTPWTGPSYTPSYARYQNPGKSALSRLESCTRAAPQPISAYSPTRCIV